MQKEHYEVLRLLNIPEVNKKRDSFWNSAKPHTSMFGVFNEYYPSMDWLLKAKMVELDKQMEYSILPKGALAYQEYLASREKEGERIVLKDRIDELTATQLHGNIFHLKYWWVFVIINIGVSLLIAWLTKGWK